VALVAACDHPIAIVTPHVEAADVVLRDLASDGAAGTVVARTRDNRRWEGAALAVADRAARPLAVELLDFQGRPVTGLDARGDVELRLESETPGVVAWEPRRGHGVLHALAPGATRVRVLVWHGTHADLVTPWLDARVHDAASALTVVLPRSR
jgi:hypothetical protein